MYDGSSDKLIAALLGSKRLTAEEIQSLKKLVEDTARYFREREEELLA